MRRLVTLLLALPIAAPAIDRPADDRGQLVTWSWPGTTESYCWHAGPIDGEGRLWLLATGEAPRAVAKAHVREISPGCTGQPDTRRRP